MQSQRYWEDVEPGEELSALEPMPTRRLVTWAAASSDFYPIHYDDEYARKNQLPGVIVHGRLKGMLVGRLLAEWAGAAGRVVRWKVDYLKMDPAREDLLVWVRAVRKYREEGEARVALEVGVRSADGTQSTRGEAVVALPERGERGERDAPDPA